MGVISRKKQSNSGKKEKKVRRTPIWNVDSVLGSLAVNYDASVALISGILIAFGIVMVFSAGYYTTTNFYNDPYYYLRRQLAWVALGIGVMALFTRWDYHKYTKHYWVFAVVSVGALALLFTPLGVTVNFATRWFQLGPLRITPSEFSKLAMIIFTAGYVAERPRRVRTIYVFVLFGVMIVHLGLIIKQPNLSTAIVIAAIMIGIMYVAGMWNGWLVLAALALIGGLIFILMFYPDSHWYARMTNFIDPFKDAQGEGYQVSQGLIALGNGGLFGLGPGKSITKNLYLPEPQNDFILAIIGEELGFVGLVVLLSVYLLLIYRCFVITVRAKDKLGFYLGAGITVMMALQVILNVAVVTASMPATGITLPFVSYGGTSLLVFMASMGIMLNISKKNRG